MTKKYVEYRSKGLCARCGKIPLNGKTRCEICHEQHLNYQRKNKLKLIAAGLCRCCGTRPKSDRSPSCEICLKENAVRNSAVYAKIRKSCIKNYGGQCQCCHTPVEVYLQLDHVKNDGAAHRKRLSKSGRGSSLYTWAYRNNFPDVLQLLCANCHQAKTSRGGCSVSDHDFNRVVSPTTINDQSFTILSTISWSTSALNQSLFLGLGSTSEPLKTDSVCQTSGKSL